MSAATFFGAIFIGLFGICMSIFATGCYLKWMQPELFPAPKAVVAQAPKVWQPGMRLLDIRPTPDVEFNRMQRMDLRLFYSDGALFSDENGTVFNHHTPFETTTKLDGWLKMPPGVSAPIAKYREIWFEERKV